MNLGDQLAALAIDAESSGSNQPIALYKTQKVFGFIPITRLDCTLTVVERGSGWGVMLSGPKNRYRADPFVGANFRKSDGERDSAWKRLKHGSWFPVKDPVESDEIFGRIEDAICRAYFAHQRPNRPA
jgi:hypothetical protein